MQSKYSPKHIEINTHSRYVHSDKIIIIIITLLDFSGASILRVIFYVTNINK